MAATFNEYTVPTANSYPYGITAGPDGAVWFTETATNKIGRISPSGVMTEYAIPTSNSGPKGITSSSGALWFTEWIANKIAKITTSGVVTEYAIPTANSGAWSISPGPGGYVWFTENSANKIGRCSSTGVITEYNVPTANSGPFGIAAGLDNAVWFTENSANKIGRCSSTGVITERTVPTAGSGPAWITADRVGDLWFTEWTGNKIGHCATAGVMNEFVVPSANSKPAGIAAASDGTIWFVEAGTANNVGRCTPAGVTNEYQITTPSSGPASAIIGPDGKLWFCQWGRNKIGRMALPAPEWYLAEGSTAWGFSTYISIENPNNTAVHAAVTYMTGLGNVSGGTLTLPAKSQTTVNPADKLGNKDFSTKVVCREGKTIAVDRTMSWNKDNQGEEAHSSVGVNSPAKTWYLAEGSSAWNFECWLLIQNPNAQTAHCQVTYMIEGQGPKTVSYTVPKESRATFDMSKGIGSADASIKVVADVPVIPERAMYRNNRREGHDSIGTITPANDYYLAEGATGYNVGYITYVLVQNPNDSPSNVSLTYMTQSGQVAGPSFQMPANSRKTVRVNDQLPPNSDVSTRVHGSKPIIAERAMYWNNGTGEACHDSIGMATPHTTFYLPDGQTSNGRETWTLVQNPNGSAVTVEVSYLKAGGGAVTLTSSIPANSRKTFNMADKISSGRASIVVTSKTSGKKIMVERAMYWNGRGAGTDTIGGFSD